MHLNLKLATTKRNFEGNRKHFGRIVFHTKDVDKLYSILKNNDNISNIISFENEPKDAPWGEILSHSRTRWVSAFICNTNKREEQNF